MKKNGTCIVELKRTNWTGWNPEFRMNKDWDYAREYPGKCHLRDVLMKPEMSGGNRGQMTIAIGFETIDEMYAWAELFYAEDDAAGETYGWWGKLTPEDRKNEEMMLRARDEMRFQSIQTQGPYMAGSKLPKGAKLYVVTPIADATKKLILLV